MIEKEVRTDFNEKEKTSSKSSDHIHSVKEQKESVEVSWGPDASSEKVVFEDYLHYAALQRFEEENKFRGEDATVPASRKHWFYSLSEHKGKNVNVDVHAIASASAIPMTPDQEEEAKAARALRLASWASIFYLITTDILGPFNAPFAISQVGWVPGVLLYFFMGLMATYSNLILWRLFIRLDSLRFPIKSYADIAERIFGKWARHLVNVLQSIQLVINVGTICLANGQSLSQISKGKLCFSVCIVIWAILGIIVGQIRSLKSYGWLANSAVWLNLLIIFTSMGFVVHSPPNYAAAKSSLGVDFGPVQTQVFTHLPLYQKVNGIMNMVFAYGGSMIFPEMMAEMRRPMDFWKGMLVAQIFICCVYFMYGSYIYAFQGQFTLPLSYQGVSKYSWQTVGNVFSLVTGILAAGLYGNIGIKVVYNNIVRGMLGGPQLMSGRGRIVWTLLVFFYWGIAFVIGSAIPQVQTITGLIAAVAIMQFTYTFPFILRFGYDVITDAMMEDHLHIAGSGTVARIDTWRDWSRWRRGIFGGRWYYKMFNLGIFLGGMSLACLGMWGAGESIKATFALSGSATSFSCAAPV